MTLKAVWHIVKESTKRGEVGAPRSATDLCPALSCFERPVGTDPIAVGNVSVQTTERYLGCKRRTRSAVNDRIGIESDP